MVAAVVAVRSRLPEGSDRRDDEARVPLAELCQIEPKALPLPGSAVLDEHVRLCHESLEHLASCLAVRGQRDGALVRVQVQEEGAALGVWNVGWERALTPRWIADPRLLELEHVGSQIREELSTVGRRYHAPQLHNGQAFQSPSVHEVPCLTKGPVRRGVPVPSVRTPGIIQERSSRFESRGRLAKRRGDYILGLDAGLSQDRVGQAVSPGRKRL